MIYSRKCVICGKEFITRYKRANVCSSECRRLKKINTASLFQKANKERRQSYEKVCEGCHTTFKGRVDQHYCSIGCYLKHQPKRKAKYDKKCVFCGKEFKAIRPENKYCSKLCAGRVKYIIRQARKFFSD